MSVVRSEVEIVVQFAVGIGVAVSAAASSVLEIETSTAGGTSAIDDGRIETTYGGVGGFVIDDATLGVIETGGTIPDGLVGEADWVDVACTELGRLTIGGCRRASRLASFDGGSADITLVDPLRRWDPLRGSVVEPGLRGEFTAAGRTTLREGVRVRVVAKWQNETVPLFTGFVRDWPTQLGSFRAAERTVRCQDWFGVLANLSDRNAQAPVGSGETVTARIHRLLDVAGVPAEERDIGSSTVTLQSTTLAANVLTELKLTVACDGGDLWVTPGGVVTFRSLVEEMQEPRRWAPQTVVTNEPARDPSGAYTDAREVMPTKPPVVVSQREVKSRFDFARSGGTAQAVFDPTLTDMIGVKVFSRSDLILQTDAQVAALAQALLDLQPRDPIGLAEVTIDPSIDRQARLHTLRRQLGDRIGVRHRDVDGATTAKEGMVSGITHTIEPPRWVCVMATEDATDLIPFTIEQSAIESEHFIAF
jgi:hypothetical protein